MKSEPEIKNRLLSRLVETFDELYGANSTWVDPQLVTEMEILRWVLDIPNEAEEKHED